MTNFEVYHNKPDTDFNCRSIRALRLKTNNCPNDIDSSDFSLCDKCFAASLNWLKEDFCDTIERLDYIADPTDKLYDIWSTYGREFNLLDICNFLQEVDGDLTRLEDLLKGID